MAKNASNSVRDATVKFRFEDAAATSAELVEVRKVGVPMRRSFQVLMLVLLASFIVGGTAVAQTCYYSCDSYTDPNDPFDSYDSYGDSYGGYTDPNDPFDSYDSHGDPYSGYTDPNDPMDLWDSSGSVLSWRQSLEDDEYNTSYDFYFDGFTNNSSASDWDSYWNGSDVDCPDIDGMGCEDYS